MDKLRLWPVLFLGILCLLASSCLSSPPARTIPHPSPARSSATDVRTSVMSWARSLLGKKTDSKIIVRGRTFILDCIGTISAAWWGAGYDIQKDFGRFSGNGVKRLYESCLLWGSLYKAKMPEAGDFIFWENTYDRNENGKLYDDGLTHAGIVMGVDPDGTVQYLHASYSRGVVLAWCNLLHPDEPFGPGNKVWNSPMFLGSSVGSRKNPVKWLSGDLWSAFGNAASSYSALGR